MHDIETLVAGYAAFRRDRYAAEAQRFHELAEQGQRPDTMVIACCDSRADPATIFSARPGELFVVRNVANLVPPHAPDGDYHGTSAAVEFAVTGLEVANIVVMGHARCGGIQAYREGAARTPHESGFIGKWMSLMDRSNRPGDADARDDGQQAVEEAAVRISLANLETFPFVAERVQQGTLRLRGAHFDIATGTLRGLDPASGAFATVPVAD